MISVLIPCFNAANVLQHTLNSVANNIKDGDEIIIVDDHSDDGSAQLAQRFLQATNIPHQIKLNPQKGACHARNHALTLSKGRLIQWLDADDLLAPQKLSAQRRHVIGDQKSLVVSPFQSFKDDLQNGLIRDDRDWNFTPRPSPADWLASGQMTIPACWLGHRSVFEEAGPWDTSLRVNQDGEYFARALAAAENLHFEAECLAYYRRGTSGSVSLFTPEKAESLFRSIRSIHQTALTIENSTRMRQMLANKYQHAIYTAYPHCPEGISHAQAQIKQLPEPTISNPNAVSTLSKAINRTFGWKNLTRMRLLRKRLSK